jgi:hypothetical protein
MASTLISLATMVESQSLNSIVAGFSFASAVAWMDVVRWIISQVININKNGGNYYFLTALATTLLAVLVFVIIKAIAVTAEIKQPQQPIYAVTR